MPDMDGAATLGEILKIDGDLPVVLVSGYTRDSEKLEALEERCTKVRFLAKPYQPGQLITTAKKLLDPLAASDAQSNRAG